MGMGTGACSSKYWVQVIKYTSGNLEHCIEFMLNNKPRNSREWYELRPIPHIKPKDKALKGPCTEYQCSLVKLAESMTKALQKGNEEYEKI